MMSFSEIERLMRNAQKVGSKVGETCCSGIQSRKFKPHIFSKCINVEQDRSPQPGLPALLLTGITKSLWPLLPHGMPLISTAPSLGTPSFPIFIERANHHFSQFIPGRTKARAKGRQTEYGGRLLSWAGTSCSPWLLWPRGPPN